MYNLVTFKDEKEGDEEEKAPQTGAAEEEQYARASLHSLGSFARDSDDIRRRTRQQGRRDRPQPDFGRLARRDTLTSFVQPPPGLLARLSATGARQVVDSPPSGSNRSRGSSCMSVNARRLLQR